MSQLVAKIDALNIHIRELTAERDALVQQELASRSPIKVGQMITWVINSLTKYRSRGRVESLRKWTGENSFVYHVTYIKKDGSEGRVRMDVYPYHDPQPALGEESAR
jgi:hypothetical protein